MIYKIIPRVRIGWRDVWIGAAVTALLFAIGKSLIGLYLGRSTFASGFGAAGSLVVLLVWMYYSAQIFLLGAEFTWVYAHVHGSRSNVGAEAAARAGAEPTSRDPAAALTRSRSRARSGDAIPASLAVVFGHRHAPSQHRLHRRRRPRLRRPRLLRRPRAPVSPVLDRLGGERPALHAGLRQLAGLLADALRADDGALPVPAARRRRGADQQQEPRQHDARPAAGASDPAVAAQGGGLPHRAHRQVAPRLPAGASGRCARATTSSSGRCRAASTTSPIATSAARTTCGPARTSTARRATSPT